MPNDEKSSMTADQQIRAAAATAAATMYGHFVGLTATDKDDLYQRQPLTMGEDALRIAQLFEQYIRTGSYAGDQLA